MLQSANWRRKSLPLFSSSSVVGPCNCQASCSRWLLCMSHASKMRGTSCISAGRSSDGPAAITAVQRKGDPCILPVHPCIRHVVLLQKGTDLNCLQTPWAGFGRPLRQQRHRPQSGRRVSNACVPHTTSSPSAVCAMREKAWEQSKQSSSRAKPKPLKTILASSVSWGGARPSGRRCTASARPLS